MPNKKVLIITYYWPPAGGPGVQRWLKFSKYLPKFGFEPIIYTPENPSYPIIDKSLLKDVSTDLTVVKTKIWEPYKIAEKLNPSTKKYKAGQFEKADNQSILTKLSVYIRGNFFIPDARKFWIKPSVKFLENYLQENQIGTVITTGPPHSIHLIGLKLKQKKSKLKWLADFRDPWTAISYHSQLKLSTNSQRKHKALEKEVVTNADCIIATSFTDAENYKNLGAKRVEVITNGFEESDFYDEKSKITSLKFKITYSGGLELARNPEILWTVLNELKTENHEFSDDLEIEFVGNLSSDVENFIKKNALTDNLNKVGYISHKESIIKIKQSSLLLLCNFPNEKSKGIIPGKLFEYMVTGNTILAIGPSGGDVERILKETNSGQYFTQSDKVEMKSFILSNYEKWKMGKKNHPSSEVYKYSRKSLTEKLSILLSN